MMALLFLSTLSLRRATCRVEISESRYMHFYPRSPCGERHTWRKVNPNPKVFLSTLSLRRATSGGHISKTRCKHFYPRSPCGERHNFPSSATVTINISIHALLAESDYRRTSGSYKDKHFYPRSPCGERRRLPINDSIALYFYPRSPCGERPERAPALSQSSAFLSTLSLRRATIDEIPYQSQVDQFLSTLSLRRATF